MSLTDLNVGDEVRYRIRFASSELGRAPCRIWALDGATKCTDAAGATPKTSRSSRFASLVPNTSSQESPLESVETSPAARERLPRLRSQRRGFNIGHPSPTGPLPAAA
jgi:hypothetical protein